MHGDPEEEVAGQASAVVELGGAAITRRLLSPDPADPADPTDQVGAGDPLQLIAARSQEIADADLVTLVRPAGNGSDLRVEVAVGVGAEDLPGRPVPRQGVQRSGSWGSLTVPPR